MKILFLGDSITDMHRERDIDNLLPYSMGVGYPCVVRSKFADKNDYSHQFINRGISGNRIVDLYARIKSDVWNLCPDVLSILIGVNDVWHEIFGANGVDLERFERVYSMLIEDTLKRLPNLKIMLLEPFVLRGEATEGAYDSFLEVKKYAKVVKAIADKYGLVFVPLQEKFDEMAKIHGEKTFLYDGVHPSIEGSTLIANEWFKAFEKKVKV